VMSVATILCHAENIDLNVAAVTRSIYPYYGIFLAVN